MSKAENIHYTLKWKRKRKDKHGDKCKRAKCGICSPHKHKGGNHSGRVKLKYIEIKNCLYA